MWRGAKLSVLILLASIVLPCIYRFAGPPGTWTMLQRWRAGASISWSPVSIEHVSPSLIRAVIAAEDARFCSHSGFDFKEIRTAVQERKSRGYLRGASTLSQQTAKNAFLWNGGGWARKGAETWLTSVIELIWPKRRIMESYLNIAEWGDGLFGAEAAARARFGVSASKLSMRQSALLAAVLPSPNKWRLDPLGPYVAGRAVQIEARMREIDRQGLDTCVLGPRAKDSWF